METSEISGDIINTLKSIQGAIEGAENKYDSIVQHLNRIEAKVTNIESELNATTKNTHDNAKDIGFLKETINRNEGEAEKQIEIIWDSGVRKLVQELKEQKDIMKDHCKTDEDAHRDLRTEITKDIMKDVKIWFYGLGFFLLVNFVVMILMNWWKK